MKRLFGAIIMGCFIFLPAVGQAAILQWDASTGATGYIVYFTDGNASHNYNNGDQITCDISLLQLTPGIEYAFHVTAFNDVDESRPSNTVAYIPPVFQPPDDSLPDIVIVVPGPVTVRIEQ
ncbi:MAG: fibronectin type III domain-containing protein [Thermodesulfobacteriota bacterium]|nr:fibronectin type III domain-containing protein [Thermodesulfobacteriota bacterium]